MPAPRQMRSRTKSDSYSVKCFAQIKKTLTAGRYTVFDIETTGGNVQENGITEVCALKYHRGKVVDKFYSMVNPQIPIPPIVRKLTGINDHTVKDAPRIQEVMPTILAFIADTVLVSHNTMSDLRFIKHFAFKACRKQVKNFYLCTHMLTTKLCPNAPDKSLKGVANYFNVPTSKAHRAEHDAELTAEIFTHLLRKLAERGIETIAEAIRLQGDHDSAMKIGWGIHRESLQNLPTCPGVVRLFDRDRRLIFKSSYSNLARDMRSLSQYRDLPRTVLRRVLQAYSVQIRPTASLFEAMLWEQGLREGEYLSKTDLGYQRTLTTIFFQQIRGRVKVGIGEVPAAASKAFGVVEDEATGARILAQIADIFAVRKGRRGIYLSEEQALLTELSLCGQLAHKRDTLENEGGNKFIDFVKSIFLNKNREDDIAKLEQIALPKPLTPLLNIFGLLVVSNYSRSAWQLYPIAHSMPIARIDTTMNWRDYLKSCDNQTAIYNKLHSAQNEHRSLVSLHNTGIINTTIWWLTNQVGKSDCVFISLSDLK